MAINLIDSGGGGGGNLSSGTSGSFSTTSPAATTTTAITGGGGGSSSAGSSGSGQGSALQWLQQDRVISDIYYLGDKPILDESIFSDPVASFQRLPAGIQSGLFLLVALLIARKLLK